MKARNDTPRRRKGPAQLGLEFRTWGGARLGSGRKPKGDKAGVSHLHRPALAARFHEHILRTPSEVKRAVHYVHRNFERHAVERAARLHTPPPRAGGADPYSSASSGHGIVLPVPRTWLLGQAVQTPQASPHRE